MDDYLAKPFKRTQLRALIQRWMNAGDLAPLHGAAAPAERPLLHVVAPARSREPAQLAALDPQALTDIRSLQRPEAPSLLTRLLTRYLDDTPALIEAMRAAQRADDVLGITRAAHTLKSASGNLGAIRLACLCNELEVAGRSGNASGAQRTIEAIAREYADVRVAMQFQLQTAAG